ncbi:MAG: hypothetical protein J7641_19220 [Cyanobacteria bacterium SID2]|nr:hypothetical protein [Cyanobacteria bacterium SID2]
MSQQGGREAVDRFLNAFLEARHTVLLSGIAIEARWFHLSEWTEKNVSKTLPRILKRSPVGFALNDLQKISNSEITELWTEYLRKYLAYDSRLKGVDSDRLLKEFYSLFKGSINLFINRYGTGWNSTIPCTFDVTILAFSQELLLVLSLGDEG